MQDKFVDLEAGKIQLISVIFKLISFFNIYAVTY
jgi:hypothetical protein